jgi:hypothetical protein
MWNMLWEAGQFRRRFFSEDELPAPIAKLADLGDINFAFVPRSRSRYFEYAPLYHLQHGDIKVLIERQPGGPTLLDSSLTDPDDYNRDNHLAPVLARGTVTALTQFD